MDDDLFLAFILTTGGFFFGILALLIYQKIKLKDFHTLSQSILAKAESESLKEKQAKDFEIKQKELSFKENLYAMEQKERRKLKEEEDRLKVKQDNIESYLSSLEKKMQVIEKNESFLREKEETLRNLEARLLKKKNEIEASLESISEISKEEAKRLFIDRIENELKQDKEKAVQLFSEELEQQKEALAKKVIVTAIGRVALACVSECTVSTVHLPGEEIKARIIGKEGRNIRTLERISGVNFLIDDTPKAIIISGFDPFRIQTAKLALTELVSDGRIHPTRIEEVFEKAKENLESKLLKTGEEAAFKVGIFNLSPQLTKLLGHLSLRYSFGQNVLEHSIEVSHLMGLMAAELNLDIKLAKRIGLLHDIGKALTHEMEGTHALIGMQIALKNGESMEVANGIGCHHQEIEPTTLEGSLTSSADALSAARPGARNEAVEDYVKRLVKLEEVASSFNQVAEAYALQAGREVRIFVKPDLVDDQSMADLARDLRKKIELNVNYPGKIKVSVLKEKKIVEYAM